MKSVIVLLFVLAASALMAERQPLERYQSIIDRQMFGQPPAGFDPEKLPSEVSKSTEKQLTQEQERLQSSVRFSGIRVSPEGEVYVSFADTSDPKNPRSYYLKVGETQEGWTVKEADPVKATMTVVKGDIEVTLTIGGSSGKDAGATVKAGGGRSAARSAGGGLLGATSLRARRLQKEQQLAEERAQKEEERQQEEARREEERAQRERDNEERRQQLQELRDELRKARELRSTEGAKKENDGQNDA